MCLSIAYKNSVHPDNIIAKNVMSIEVKNNFVILTDLMERKYEVNGTLEKAHLTDGYLIIKTK